jgi:hypothetical protein
VTRALWILALLAGACGPSHQTTVVFPRSDDALVNPERGYFVDVDLVNGRDFRDVRARGYTLGFAYVRLDAWRTVALSPDLIDSLGKGLEAARDAGIKVILRFAYNDAANGEDAPKWAVLAHIEQLTPLLQQNADVIAVLDAGFIGAWGEWHSSTHGLDDQANRGDVLWQLLAAMPKSRSVLVRSPVYKVAAYGDTIAAFDGSDASRVGLVNSCFLASDDDMGTYGAPVEQWKDYVARDGLGTPVGGETCRLYQPRTDCPTALEELRRLHWSFLNAQYHEDVIATWRTEGCYEEIGRDLGYRLELEAVSFPETVVPGAAMDVTIRMRNDGYAPMYNARPVFLVVDDDAIALPDDPRRWAPGEIVVRAHVRAPPGLATGPHRLALWLPDADPRLQTPERAALFAVRIGGATWTDGYNVLTESLTVVGKSNK